VPGASIAVIVHLEATPARTYDEVAAAKRSPARKLVGARPGRNSDSIELHSLPSYPLTDPHQSDILQYGQIGSGNACYRNQLALKRIMNFTPQSESQFRNPSCVRVIIGADKMTIPPPRIFLAHEERPDL
jgi:hypothetical protein